MVVSCVRRLAPASPDPPLAPLISTASSYIHTYTHTHTAHLWDQGKAAAAEGEWERACVRMDAMNDYLITAGERSFAFDSIMTLVQHQCLSAHTDTSTKALTCKHTCARAAQVDPQAVRPFDKKATPGSQAQASRAVKAAGGTGGLRLGLGCKRYRDREWLQRQPQWPPGERHTCRLSHRALVCIRQKAWQ